MKKILSIIFILCILPTNSLFAGGLFDPNATPEDINWNTPYYKITTDGNAGGIFFKDKFNNNEYRFKSKYKGHLFTVVGFDGYTHYLDSPYNIFLKDTYGLITNNSNNNTYYYYFDINKYTLVEIPLPKPITLNLEVGDFIENNILYLYYSDDKLLYKYDTSGTRLVPEVYKIPEILSTISNEECSPLMMNDGTFINANHFPTYENIIDNQIIIKEFCNNTYVISSYNILTGETRILYKGDGKLNYKFSVNQHGTYTAISIAPQRGVFDGITSWEYIYVNEGIDFNIGDKSIVISVGYDRGQYPDELKDLDGRLKQIYPQGIYYFSFPYISYILDYEYWTKEALKGQDLRNNFIHFHNLSTNSERIFGELMTTPDEMINYRANRIDPPYFYYYKSVERRDSSYSGTTPFGEWRSDKDSSGSFIYQFGDNNTYGYIENNDQGNVPSNINEVQINLNSNENSFHETIQPMSKVFKDISTDSKFYIQTKYLKDKNIVNGYTDGTFRVSNNISRAEFLKILLEGIPSIKLNISDKQCFSDVMDEWFAQYVCLAKRMNWVKGYNGNLFKPNNFITRAEAAKIISEVLKISDKKNSNISIFSDVDTNEWFFDYVTDLLSKNIIEKSQNFYPRNNLTRGDMATYIYNVFTISNIDLTNLVE